ncbi:hypothetical protein WR25_26293 isoform B [Diploscapter pachys]|uniref:Galactosylgalactosylxylosylprotein 3-beta-glucuronosyltransferase n=2 Tax=Diploscapter pachys TaxID=2018661 RepID=A0A2A2JPN6_9BILA|nr:hypothetical protein WR25_26293 isoform A [Diploscapter pachys]PAV63776.1 hypothetical protein WR25_26293 isoform B [Diploscapter pachys]
MHVKNLHWIVVEDDNKTSVAVERILYRSGISYVYLHTTTEKGMPSRGWAHRNLAIKYAIDNYKPGRKAVLYFADDDNTYDIRLFDKYIRRVKNIGFWAVGLSGSAKVEAPKVNGSGTIVAWDVVFAPKRDFAIDMAGFAVNMKLMHKTKPSFNKQCQKEYKVGPETCFLKQFGLKKEKLEPFGWDDKPKEILVWHTQTVKTKKTGGADHGYVFET